MFDRKQWMPLVHAAVLGAALIGLEARTHAAPLAPQGFVELQGSTPGVQQSGHTNISGTGIFGTSLGVGTSFPAAGLHVLKEAIPPGGTFALEGVTHTYMSFFPQGVASGRKAYFGFPAANSQVLQLTNEFPLGKIVFSTGPFGGVGINITPGGGRMLDVYTANGSGYAVFGDNASGTGSAYGVFGRTSSTAGYGVYGLALSSTGSCTGVNGRSDSTTGRGVYGTCTKTTGTNYGVYGYSGSPSGYALYGQGRFAATGTKSFVIDHPFDPENKTLTHYCSEGAEPLNVYSGKALLDQNGRAWIALPDYFEEINADPRYTLTAIGAAMPELHVASEVRDNRFEIAGGAPGMKVSWRVEGVRNDRFVQRYGAPVEQVKEPEMRGKYLGPELYGQPMERGLQYVAED